MGNVLEQNKQQQVLALGRLGWTLTRIGHAPGVHRVTAGEYLRAARIPVRGRGRPGEGAAKPTISGPVSADSDSPPALFPPEGSTDSRPSRAPTASACEPYRALIAEALSRGRNARAIWQDLTPAALDSAIRLFEQPGGPAIGPKDFGNMVEKGRRM